MDYRILPQKIFEAHADRAFAELGKNSFPIVDFQKKGFTLRYQENVLKTIAFEQLILKVSKLVLLQTNYKQLDSSMKL